jgi:hypothetical protein
LFIKPGAMLPSASDDPFFDSAETDASFDVPLLLTLEDL